MALLACFAVFFLLTAAPGAVGQKGFLSIDCGLDANSNGYNDTNGVFYVPDGSFVDGGENHVVAADQEGKLDRPYRTLRSFPSGDRNCYALPTVAGAKYLLRVVFFYGNYDGKDSSSTLQFDLYIGVDRWATVKADGKHWYEALFMAWASWAPVCLVKTDPHNTPFVSSVELRTMGSGIYADLKVNESMSLVVRGNTGSSNSVIRYSDDPYDRYWWPVQSGPLWKNISTVSPIKLDPNWPVPLSVMQTAIEAVSNNTKFISKWQDLESDEYRVYLHFADFQNTEIRQLNVTINELEPFLFIPPYLAHTVARNVGWYKSKTTIYSITVGATTASKLPVMINAFEFYTRIPNVNPKTLPRDFDAIMAIKFEYGIKKNWMGDPCFPTALVWEGVGCSNTSGNTMTIISLDLSHSNLHGPISNNFTLLTALQSLNLLGNQLSGPIPDGLCNKQSLIFRFGLESNGNSCIVQSPPEKNGNRAVIAIWVVVPVTTIGALILIYLIWRHKTKANVFSADPPRDVEIDIAPGSRKDNADALQKVENRQFTYKELEKFTNKFSQFIGQGGFGLVYYGRLEDGMEVAVKVRSESSSHGLDEFFAEVQSLTKVHHRNLVSLVGYCRENNHLALVYEYMARGSLYDHLRGNNDVRETLNWRTRLRVVIEVAQGIDYLHKGCSLPIIHRDVKTQNILLGQKLQAKIADFGLCKTYLSDTQTHISVTPAGSAGYIDPEYYHTGRLTESSDVYSFGVVLLEIVTGESPILPGQGHIIQLVKKKIAEGNIGLIADARLRGSYDVSSMWKVVDIALLCTADICAQRPTMAVVIMQLKESLALEDARLDSGFRGSISTVDETTFSTTTLSPSAR
ncbi:probable LRR receptor-like serine/threonine-protein kinase At1g51860 [Oryza brachyantha]|uniref:probable LRR receptor-like serine/threonine-protein kinase At1g51860 n=1 Tax=Oryza brachyantha TaxID=4533 RepID=UPI001AD97401|nr:probable LRR receptor-like serine/threonine-protein kinase At1g51860 [Oryza brachyantha]